ncbi:Glutamate/aspartate import permease protein GltJ [Methylobacterium mesophilicum]|uniref:amino acid ABC transporter permease n=1 Tax=Methylobacterium TaxID=407 RepID=UPI0011C7932E|nr:MULTISPECIES: amino acid ABC transporter permease [Methylobacterium]TXN43087.1 amino acid ABC transporter permease [Methylobacterium sp. WL7]TXN75818.1 amino acid ABC transporter permease [Methylobacterium sp. WL18]GJE24670.1 Glutamate/aspartate import permease protein GltJ [Methylobacterium mesophilicum]
MSLFGDLLAPRYLIWLLQGFGVTLALSASVCLAGTGLGLALCCLREAGGRLAGAGTTAFIGLIRNTPLLVQLFFWYFGAAALMPSWLTVWLNSPHGLALGPAALHWPAYETLSGFLGLTLYAAAYIAEECRAGLNGVRPAQREAALALGLTDLQVFRHIALPQALRIAWLPVVGQYLDTIKNTSLTMTIGLAELSYASREVETETFLAFQAFGIATLLYVGAVAAVEAAGHALARRDPARAARR